MQIGTSREASTPVWVFFPEYFHQWFSFFVRFLICVGGFKSCLSSSQVWGVWVGRLGAWSSMGDWSRRACPLTTLHLTLQTQVHIFLLRFFSCLFVGFFGCRVQQQHVIATLISNYIPSPPQGSLSSLQLCFSFWGRGAKWYQPRRRDFSFTKRFPVLRMNFRFWEICSMIQVFIW